MVSFLRREERLEDRFTSWTSWVDRNELQNVRYPGVYIIAQTDQPLTDDFSWREEIIYIGMTNSGGGLQSRLHQFDKTLRGDIKHGGADRVLYKYRDYKTLVPSLHVAVYPVVCNVKSDRPADLRLMGEVCRLEYACLAEYAERYGRLPEFNDKKRSPKFSLTN